VNRDASEHWLMLVMTEGVWPLQPVFQRNGELVMSEFRSAVACVLSSLDRDSARLGFIGFRKRDVKDAALIIGFDLVVLHRTRERY